MTYLKHGCSLHLIRAWLKVLWNDIVHNHTSNFKDVNYNVIKRKNTVFWFLFRNREKSYPQSHFCLSSDIISFRKLATACVFGLATANMFVLVTANTFGLATCLTSNKSGLVNRKHFWSDNMPYAEHLILSCNHDQAWSGNCVHVWSDNREHVWSEQPRTRLVWQPRARLVWQTRTCLVRQSRARLSVKGTF